MKNSLSIYYQNVRGLRTKSHELLSNVLHNDYDIICLTESWLNDSFYSSEYFDSRYEVYRCDRDASAHGCSRGGGVVVAVRRELCPSAQPAWCAPPPADELWVSIPMRGRTSRPTCGSAHEPAFLHIACTYIPHSPRHEYFLNSFYDRTVNLIHSNSDDVFLIVGDFNVSNANWQYNHDFQTMTVQPSSDALTILTTDFINLSLLSQYNGEFNMNNRILDLILCTKLCNVMASNSPLVTEDRHHKALDIYLPIYLPASLKQNNLKKKMYFSADFESIKNGLDSVDWDIAFSGCKDVDTMLTVFYNLLNDLIDKYVPVRTQFNTQKYPPWYSRPLVKLSNEKRKYHRKWKIYGNQADYRMFSLLRSRLRKLETDTYHKYLAFSEERIRENPDFFWSYVKSKKQSEELPQRMIYGNNIFSTGTDICNAFNDFFQSAFVNTSNDDINVDVRTENSHLIDLGNVVLEETTILKLLEQVDVHKGSGSDGIHPILIANCAKELLKPVHIIFQTSLNSGVFPNLWKRALITPIPKNKQKEQITQYRPISKLCILGKILEKIVTSQLSFAIRHQISDKQHGFIKARSVDSNMVTFVDFVLNAMDRDMQVDAVYTDFSKAFDKISHNLLIRKLWRVGVHGNLLRWLESYIRNRSQAVCAKGYCSSFLPIPSGVPQGSHLGPVLFSIYINDLQDYLQNCDHLQYADDTKIFRIIRNQDDCLGLQSDLDALNKYCIENQLFLNTDKCHVITFTRKSAPISFNYMLNDTNLKRVDSTRDLGIIMDSKLTFGLHFDSIIQRSFRNLGFINRITKPFKKIITLKILYFSFVRSILDFGSVVWNPHFKQDIDKIEKVQRKFIKLLNFRSNCSNESYEESLKKHKLLTLQNRRKQFDLIFLHKILNCHIDSPTLLSRINFITKTRLPARSSRSIQMFVPPRSRKKYTRNNFFTRCLTMYNNEFSSIDLFDNSLNRVKSKVVKKLLPTLSPS